MTEEVDAVVVGGGIAGASCLYHLARNGLALTLSGTVNPAGAGTGIVQLTASTLSFRPGSTFVFNSAS